MLKDAMRKRITSKDLAKLAGVSSATVSRAFTADARISGATRERIRSMAQEHGYQPNAIARSLNMRRSGLVALVVNAIENQCESEQLQRLVQRLQERDLLPIVLCCGDVEDRLQLMRLASTYQVDHVVVFSDMISLEEAVKIFHTARPIIVSLQPLKDDSVSHVRIEGGKAAAEIIDKAVRDGRRHFAYLTGRRYSWIDKARRAWFADALKVHDLSFEVEGHGDYTYESGLKETVVMLRRSKVDAVVCGNDIMAIGVRDAASHLLGRNVPGDLAVIGQDGISMAAWECHNLTTLATDQVAYIDAIVKMIEAERAEDHKTSVATIECKVRWGSTC
jgi:DNA-binding LacI/PurR family transcriptional regulator